jgi:hypothetical protein
MEPVRHRRFLHAAVLALLVSMGWVMAAEAFEHTDDGCVVETHCLVCQWHYGATVVPTVTARPAVPVDLVWTLVEPATAPAVEGARLETPSRAPPLA